MNDLHFIGIIFAGMMIFAFMADYVPGFAGQLSGTPAGFVLSAFIGAVVGFFAVVVIAPIEEKFGGR